MGRNCGDIAMRTAIATGAEMVIVPEMEWDLEEVADRLKFLISKGNTRATLVISEHCWHKMKPFDWRKVIAQGGFIIHARTSGKPLNYVRPDGRTAKL